MSECIEVRDTFLVMIHTTLGVSADALNFVL